MVAECVHQGSSVDTQGGWSPVDAELGGYKKKWGLCIQNMWQNALEKPGVQEKLAVRRGQEAFLSRFAGRYGHKPQWLRQLFPLILPSWHSSLFTPRHFQKAVAGHHDKGSCRNICWRLDSVNATWESGCWAWKLRHEDHPASLFPMGFPFRVASYTSAADTTSEQTLIHNKPHANHVTLFTYCPLHRITWTFLAEVVTPLFFVQNNHLLTSMTSIPGRLTFSRFTCQLSPCGWGGKRLSTSHGLTTHVQSALDSSHYQACEIQLGHPETALHGRRRQPHKVFSSSTQAISPWAAGYQGMSLE